MDYCMYFYCLLVFFTSQVLAFNPRYVKLPSSSSSISDDTDLKFGQRDLNVALLDLEERKTAQKASSYKGAIDQETASSNARKSPGSIPVSAWWPSKVDYSDTYNNILISRSESVKHDAERPAATFDELETQNANIYNPLLNLDHYPIPSKKYTFVELENMNANQYNPYLD